MMNLQNLQQKNDMLSMMKVIENTVMGIKVMIQGLRLK